MTSPLPPRGTRVGTEAQCAQIRAESPSRSLRDSIDAICAAFPALTRSWVKRHHARLMAVPTPTMARLIENAAMGLNADILDNPAKFRALLENRLNYADPTGEHASNLATYGGGRR